MDKYNVFHRTFWKRNKSWPGGREPGCGRKHYIERGVSEDEARRICKEYNTTHEPGFLSDKAEYERA